MACARPAHFLAATRAAGLVGVLASAVPSAGCLATNTYTTPEALSPGQIEVALAPEVSFLTRKLGPTEGGRFPAHRESLVEANVLFPTAVARLGVVRRVDVALGGGGSLPRADFKVQLIEGALAVALDPTARTTFVSESPWEVELPVLLGGRLSERVYLLSSPGVAYARVPTLQGNGAPTDTDASAVWARFGGGVRIHVSTSVALQPEGSFLTTVHGARGQWSSAGIACVFTPAQTKGSP
jgi:hypothetical protein